MAREPFAGGWLVTVRSGPHDLEVVVAWDVLCALGSSLILSCAPRHPHLFDRATGARIEPDEAAVAAAWHELLGDAS